MKIPVIAITAGRDVTTIVIEIDIPENQKSDTPVDRKNDILAETVVTITVKGGFLSVFG